MSRVALIALAAASATLAGTAGAGGIERSILPLGALFEEGNYVELSFSGGLSDVSGTAPPGPPFFGFASGDMSVGFGNVGAAYKGQLTEEVALALFYEQPYGADIAYPDGTNYYAEGATAELDTQALTAVAKYQFPSNVSVYGGLRFQTLEAVADLPYVQAGYTVEGERDEAWGWLVGVAYERPEIALRVSLTYASEITHELETSENALAFIPTGIAAAGSLSSTTEIVTPRSLTLDFQTGVAADTLVFGFIRWVEWTAFDITPSGYSRLPGQGGEPLGALVEFEDDRITYSLGVGRQLNESWAVAGTIGYEPSTGSVAGNLGPTDGFTSVGVGVTYTHAALTVTTGLRYVWLGDAETPQGSDFDENEAVGAAIRIGYNF